MELFTLSITVAIATLVMAITAATLYLFSNKTNDSYLLDWTLASTCFLIYGLLTIAVMTDNIRADLVPLVPNTFFLTGHAAILSGVYKLTGKTSAWRLVFFTAVSSGIFHAIPAVSESFMLRAYVLYPFLIALYGTAIYALCKDRHSPYSRAYIPLAIIFALYIFQTLLRSFIAVAEDIAMRFLGNDIIQTSGTLATIVLFFSLTVCFALTVSWRKEVDLQKKANTDHLTGWLNRSSLEVTALGIVEEAKRRGTQVAFILIDIDNFKSINDKYGHATGDIAIQHTCLAAKQKLRTYDKCFRLGGEEFLIIVNDTTPTIAQRLSERIRQSIEQKPIDIDSASINLTVSIGIALTERDMAWSTALDNADNALYRAKGSGRNRVVEHATMHASTAS